MRKRIQYLGLALLMIQFALQAQDSTGFSKRELPLGDEMPVVVVLDSLFDTDIVTAFENDRGYEGQGYLYRPVSIALDRKNNIYISDLGNFTVTKTENLQGKGWMYFGHSINSPKRAEIDFRMPYGIDVSEDGEIAVADWGNNRIVLFGKTWRSWGEDKPGSGFGRFQSPRDVSFGPDGSIYVIDTGNSRIVRIFPDKPATEWEYFGQKGSSTGEFVNPQGITVTGDGRIYIADSGNHRIVRINDMSGRAWKSMGKPGNKSGDFRNPRMVTEGPDSKIYVADQGNGRLIRMDDMDCNGWSELIIPAKERPPRPHDLAFDKREGCICCCSGNTKPS